MNVDSTSGRVEWIPADDAGGVVGWRCADCGVSFTWRKIGPKDQYEVTDSEFRSLDHGEECGYGENTPHRPPKYVEGHYKPLFGDPEADYAIVAYPLDRERKGRLATTDSKGDAAGVVRQDEKPLYEGSNDLVGHVYDGEIKLREFWEDRVDISRLEI